MFRYSFTNAFDFCRMFSFDESSLAEVMERFDPVYRIIKNNFSKYYLMLFHNYESVKR